METYVMYGLILLVGLFMGLYFGKVGELRRVNKKGKNNNVVQHNNQKGNGNNSQQKKSA